MSEKSRKKAVLKTLLIIFAVILTLLCLVPIPSRIKDGGSVYYTPVIPVYNFTRWNGFWDENTRTAGVTVNLFGLEVYNSFHHETH